MTLLIEVLSARGIGEARIVLETHLVPRASTAPGRRPGPDR
jgi:hypothetical protein